MATNAAPRVSFATLPSDILTRVSLESTLLDSDIPTIKDLTAMLALIFTCRSINNALSLSANPSLYASVFRLMFDDAAIKRRLGSAAVVSSALAREFPVRIRVLLRIKAASEAGNWDSTPYRDDWNQYGNSYVLKILVIMSENEGRNSYQLTHSGVMQLSEDLVTQLLHFGLESVPPSHQPCMTLTFVLIWMLSSRDNLAHEDPDRRAAILDFLEPLMLHAYEPAKEFNGLVDKTHLVSSRYFGSQIHVRIPSLMQLARLCSVDRYNVAKKTAWTEIGGFETRASSASRRFDVDWLRMVSILSSPSGDNLTGNAYTIGQFQGIFEGAFFITHFTPDSSKFLTSSRFLQCCLREYHSRSADECIQFVEENIHREGDALARAWFPEDIELYEDSTQTSLRIRDPSRGRSLYYTTYAGHSSSVSDHEVPIYDTIIIGETHPSFAQYGIYGFHGRVRARDGTVILVRTPVEPLLEDEGTLVFVGHLHAETDFVGDWRLSSMTEDIPGGYGWFHMSKSQVIGSLEM